MRAVIQRVTEAQVTVEEKVVGQIKTGLLVLLAIHHNDQKSSIKKLADKLLKLRLFNDPEGKINLSVSDISGELLIISQFTLYGDTTRGNRPSFIESARPDKAQEYYEAVIAELKKSGLKIEHGQFQTHMSVSLVNDGPTTVIVDVD